MLTSSSEIRTYYEGNSPLCYVFISGVNVHELMTKPHTQGSPELMQLWAKPRAILNLDIPRIVFLQRPEIQLERSAWKQIALCCKPLS